MKKNILIVMCLLLMGCAVTTQPTLRKLTNISEITVGMTKQEVKAVMGGEVVIGYEKSDNASGTFVPVTMKNPIRTEYLKSAGKNYEVEFYFTQIKQADGTVSDDELTPMVFENNRLAGKDWDFLNNLKKLGY